MLFRDVQESHSASLLRIFNSFSFYPILRKAGARYAKFITWMTASTDIFGDRTDQEIDYKASQEMCRLCGIMPESRQHLLTDCPLTVPLISEFVDRVKEISSVKLLEFTQLPVDERWLWILGSGVIPIQATRRTPRLVPLTSIFKGGESVQTGFDRKDPVSASYAYYEFKEIEYGLGSDDIVIYTDGSFKDGCSGAAAVIYKSNQIIQELSVPTVNMSIAYAELFAIYCTQL